MVDYSKWDKLAALVSSSDDDNTNDDPNKYDNIMKDKWNSSSIAKKPTDPLAPKDDDYKLPRANNDITDKDVDDMADAVDAEFFDKHYEEIAPFFLASNEMYNIYKQKYAKEIQSISEASSKISAPNAKLSQNDISNKINQWSKGISIDLLNYIFSFAINPKEKVLNPNNDKYNSDKDPRRFVIILLNVCKNWRIVCIQNDIFWEGVIEFIVRGGKYRGMSWKKLLITPIKYLNKFCCWYNINDFEYDEHEKYKKILKENGYATKDDDYYDDYGMATPQTNIFLGIQCLKYCRNTTSIYLTGVLCDDIFYAIGKYCNDMRRLEIKYVESGNNVWFRHLVKDDAQCKNTIFLLNMERSYWVNDDGLKHLGKLTNLQSIEMDRLYNVSSNGIKHLFENNNGKEMRNIYLTRGIKYDIGTLDMMKLMIKNGKKMVQIEFTECEGFGDECLKLLMDKTALPELKALHIRYTGCTQNMVDKLEKARPTVEIDFEEADY